MSHSSLPPCQPFQHPPGLAVIEQAGDGLFVCGLDGRLLDVNQEACDSLGYTRAELLRLNLTEIEISGHTMTALASCWERSPGKIESLIGRHRRKDGTTFPVEARVSLLVRDGRKLLLALTRAM